MILKKLALLLFSFLMAPAAFAQLSKLNPQSMEHLDVPNSGAENWAHIEIAFSEPVEGMTVVADSRNSSQDPEKASTPKSVFARGITIAPAGIFAKKVTLHHPDFMRCVIHFDSIGFKQTLKPGESYRINVEVPSSKLVKANKAFADLDFDAAKTLYSQVLDNPLSQDEAAVAAQRTGVIGELNPATEYLRANGSKTDKNTRFRCLKAAEMIYGKTHSRKAYAQWQEIRKDLYGNKSNTDYDDGVTELRLDTLFLVNGDNRPMSDTELPHDAEGNPIYSWINVNVDLKEVTFTGGNQFKDAEMKDGAYRLYVPKGKPAAIVMHQPDCAPLSINPADFGIDEIKPASVYEVKVKSPAVAVIEADKAFGNLDFPTAQMLYESILDSPTDFDDYSLELASARYEDVTPLVSNDMKSRWNELRKEVNLKGGPLTRQEISAKCNQLASIASDLAKMNVPGMKRKADTYSKLAKDYKTAVYLNINAKEVNKNKEVALDKNGNPKAYTGGRIVLVFDKIGYMKDYEVVLEPTGTGSYRKYLPLNVSEYLVRTGGKGVKVTPKQRVWKGNGLKLEKIGDDFEIDLDDDDRNFSITLFLQDKNK